MKLSAGHLTILAVLGISAINALSFGDTSLTIYNTDLGLIRETRNLTLRSGTHEIILTDVAARIDPTSVKIRSLTDPATRILEQNFRYDGLLLERMLVNYLDREIRIVDRKGNNHTGILLAIGQTATPILNRPNGAGGNDLILMENNSMVLIEGGPKQVVEPAVDDSLVLVPTLAWIADTQTEGDHQIELSYLSGGLSWSADYTLLVHEENELADLNGWVTLNNQSGADYRNTLLKLIAGDVHREQMGRTVRRGREALYAGAAVIESDGLVERGLFEYHLYELQRHTDVLDNEQKQVELLAAQNITTPRTYIFDVGLDPEKVNVELKFKNEKENQLGMPLPKGRIRTFSRDADGTLQFVGEASIDHTPKDETVKLQVGKSFDLRGERKVLDVKDESNLWRRVHTETVEIKLRNHKTKKESIIVREHLGGRGNWEIVKKSHAFEKKDQWTIEFPVEVNPDHESLLTYTVRYTRPR